MTLKKNELDELIQSIRNNWDNALEEFRPELDDELFEECVRVFDTYCYLMDTYNKYYLQGKKNCIVSPISKVVRPSDDSQ